MDKQMLSFDAIESQAAMELPDREMMALVNVTVVDVANQNNVLLTLQLPIGIAANVCGVNAAVLALAAQNASGATCTATASSAADFLANLPRGQRP